MAQNAAFAVQILLTKAAKVACAMPAMKHPGCALFAAQLRAIMTVTAITAIRISGITAVAAAEPGRHTGPRTAFARIAGVRVKHKAKQSAPSNGGAGFTCTEVSNFSLALCLASHPKPSPGGEGGPQGRMRCSHEVA